MILVNFFGTTFLILYDILLFYYTKVWKLSKIYKWQTAILLLAIDYHTKITTGNHTDVEAWILPQDCNQYYSPTHILVASSISKKYSTTTSLQGPAAKERTEKVC